MLRRVLEVKDERQLHWYTPESNGGLIGGRECHVHLGMLACGQ